MVGEKTWWLFDDSDETRRRAAELPGAWRTTEEQYIAELDALEAALAEAEGKIEESAADPAIDLALESEDAISAEEVVLPEETESIAAEATSAIEELHALLESARESAYENSLEAAPATDDLLSEEILDAASRWAGPASHLVALPSLDEGEEAATTEDLAADVIDPAAMTEEKESVALETVETLSPLQQMMRNVEVTSWRVEVPGEPPMRREAPMIARTTADGKTTVLAPFATPATKSQLREGLRLAHARIIDLLGENDHAVIAVCSAYAGEGKTTMALALADMLADEFPRQMLLIDAHLRSPGVHGALDVDGSPGTKDCLEHGAVVSGAIRWSGRHWVMPAGDGPIDPTALTWEGERGLLRTLKALFRVTIVDMPAVVAHAQEASLLARWADGVVWVAAAASAPADAVSSAVDVVGREKLLGVVLNKRKAALPGWLERLF